MDINLSIRETFRKEWAEINNIKCKGFEKEKGLVNNN